MSLNMYQHICSDVCIVPVQPRVKSLIVDPFVDTIKCIINIVFLIVLYETCGFKVSVALVSFFFC